MKSLYLTLVITCLASLSFSQSSYNFGFESLKNGEPVDWSTFGGNNYAFFLDSTESKSGNYAACIQYIEDSPDFKALAFTLPENFEGKKITLSGFIKTEEVTDGYAGLWMRIDPNIAFDNMSQNGVTGTTDWQEYIITLDLNPEKTQAIVIGGLLVGKGKMWLDDLRVSIDGKDIKDAQILAKTVYPAELDSAFDKGSMIQYIPDIDSQLIKLKQLGLIWGFLKYHHPEVALGNYNWDYELFRILPKVLESQKGADLDKVFIDWIQGLGELVEGNPVSVEENKIKLLPDLEWIHSAGYSEHLVSLLNQVKNSQRPADHYYIGLQPMVGNPEFKNESIYDEMTYPDTGFRLLALYRFWNIIHYYFPYRNLIEEDWEEVLTTFIPKFIEAKNKTEYTLASLALIGRIHDTHANVWGSNPILAEYFGQHYAPLALKFVEEQAVVIGYLDENLGRSTGLEVGDIITAVNDKTVEEIIAWRLDYTPASNYPTKLRDIARNLLRTNEPTLRVTYKRNGEIRENILETVPQKDINTFFELSYADTAFTFISEDIAYINHGLLQRSQLPKIWEVIENCKGLIIDIRNYPSDFPLYDLSNLLMPESLPFVKISMGSLEHPGLFTFIDPISVGSNNENYYKGKVVILINETSQSSAEFHAMAYRQHPQATVIGSTTAAADGNVSPFYLPGGIRTMISGIGIYSPDGTETQRVGIIPDIEIKPSLEGIQQGRDELVEKAIEIILKN